MSHFLRRITPKFVFDIYHRTLGWLAAVVYGRPGEELIVIGVTGTNGKSTVVYLISELLRARGKKVGSVSTISFRIGEKTWLNDLKMTTPGRFFLQRSLRQMVSAGCEFAVLEMSSESVLQHRHKQINFDAMVFTNLTPEHLERHGGFENYKQAKLELFRHLKTIVSRSTYNVSRKGPKLKEKFAVINADDKYAEEFLEASPEKKITYSLESANTELQATTYKLQPTESVFTVFGIEFKAKLLGKFNIYNCLAALATVTQFGISLQACRDALSAIPAPAGRLELIDQGQDFRVVVDYAPEPFALNATYEALKVFSYTRLIHVLGSTGGGRDKARRPELGKLAGETADVVIVTNEDPYDENPETIINEVAAGVTSAGKKENENLFKILDRRQAIAKAFRLAESGDLVLLTGKGSEQAIVASGGKKIPWDERRVAREELQKFLLTKPHQEQK